MLKEITFAGLTAEPGEKVAEYLVYPGSKHKIPVAIINGKGDGKTLLITASIHGFEYPGIQASAELVRELDPNEISGAVVIVPVVNASGFYGRNPYICPEDDLQQNLNRLGPGKPDGTFGEKLIYFMLEEFVKKSDFHVDLHSGDATEELLRFCAIGNAADPEVREFVHQVIHHLPFNYHTQSSGSTEFYNSSAKYYGVPSMMFECGGSGTWDREEVEFEKDSLRKIMQMLDILPGHPPYNPDVRCIHQQSWIEVGYTGFFYSMCKVGDDIVEGQKLFEIRDAWGNLLNEHYAKHDGKVFILNNTLGVTEGDDAIFYGSSHEHKQAARDMHENDV